MSYSASAVISRAALTHNYTRIREQVPHASIMAVVKANAYGHGIVPVSLALPDADSLAVARLEEARQLRDAGVRRPIVLLEGVFDHDDLRAARALDCELVVHIEEQITLLRGWRQPGDFAVWLKFDSGMNRLGFDADSARSAWEALSALASVRSVRLMSHFASADEDDAAQTDAQLARIRRVLDRVPGDISFANSPAALSGHAGLARLRSRDDQRQLWLRPGVALYGVSPFPTRTAEELGLRPAMSFTARIIAIRDLAAGDRVGYGGRFVAPRAMRLGVAAAGYGDGYPRQVPDGTRLLVDGVAGHVAGAVSMDMLAADVSGVGGVRIGSEVMLWGPGMPVEYVARAVGTIPYELVTRVADRVERRLV
jgi:alanine racemase